MDDGPRIGGLQMLCLIIGGTALYVTLSTASVVAAPFAVAGLGAVAWLVGPEDLPLGLALQQRDELLLLDRLALEEDLADRRQRLTVLTEDVLGALVGALDDPADLVVDLARD